MRASLRVASLFVLLPACASAGGDASAPGARVDLAIAPLDLPGVTNACYTVTVTNGQNQMVWTRSDLCADAYGDGSGAVSYVGSCDAASGAAQNTVKLTLDAIYDASGEIPTTDYADPGELTKTVTCQQDADVAVEFDLTVSRRATQGFFDIAVTFEDVFCSAKLDCKKSDGQPIDLLFDASGQRARTLVVGLSCTNGSADSSTWVYRDPITLDCGAAGVAIIDPEQAGNLSDGAGITDPSDILFGAAVHKGTEQLGYHKVYWNVLLGMRDVAAACTLTTSASASGALWDALTSPAGTTYPYIAWNVPITDASGALTCSQHPVGGSGAHAGVAVAYANGRSFQSGYDGAAIAGGPGLPTCQDGAKNGDETAVDCGGSCVANCATGQACLTGADCVSTVCSGGTCADAALGGVDTPAIDCAQIVADDPLATSGLYWLDPNGGNHDDAFQAYCDMTTDSGGWTLVLQASTTSAYTYSDPIWTNTAAPLSNVTDADVVQDMASEAFYSVVGQRSMLCMGDLSHCNAWSHAAGTPRDLSNGPVPYATQTTAASCNSFECGANTRPESINGATSGTWSAAWHRFGYVNDVNSWGPDIRVGFSGDNDSSDSQDSVIGLGLACNDNCLSQCTDGTAHGTGSGYYLDLNWANSPYDGALAGYLYTTRPAPVADGQACSADLDCISGHCADGLCCDQACDGLCQSCAVSGSEGACTAFDAGTDPLGQCGATSSCSGGGGCLSACASTPSVLGCASTHAGASCDDIKTSTGAPDDGLYWIDPDGAGAGQPFQVYCDMTTDGGGWTLVMQTSSTSAYFYADSVWTSTAPPAGSNDAVAAADADAVSRAFYEVTGTQSMLCMSDLTHCSAWNHAVDTPRNLANGSRMSSSSTASATCSTIVCGADTFPDVMSALMGGSSSDTWHRWGYVNDINGWGTKTRVGYTGDGDSSDSSDTIMGLGVECSLNCRNNDCTNGCHDQASGFYGYAGWNVTPLDGALPGFLFVR